MEAIGSSMVTIYKIFKVLAATVASVSLIYIAIGYLSGNAQEDNRRLDQAKRVLIAVICVWMLSSFITVAKKVGSSYAWNPSTNSGFEVGTGDDDDDKDDSKKDDSKSDDSKSDDSKTDDSKKDS